jgi:TrmH family RNA methyltransferase
MAEAAPRRAVQRYRMLARGSTSDGVEREILLDGLHLLFEAHASGISIDSAAFEEPVLARQSVRSLAEQLASGGADVFIVSRKVLEAMSPVKTPTGAVGIGRRSLMSLSAALRAVTSRQLVVIAHDVQDPGNLGGMMRTAEAAGASAFIASLGTADPLGWKALRGSMGSALRLPIARAEAAEALRECRNAGLLTAALVPRGGESFFEVDFRPSTAVFLGGEGGGLPSEISRHTDREISIPMRTPVESLNVGVAAALVLYEAFRQRNERT